MLEYVVAMREAGVVCREGMEDIMVSRGLYEEEDVNRRCRGVAWTQ